MLSPASRELLANTVIVKRREINDAHLSLHSHESEIRGALRTIGRLEAEVLSLMADLERDDQARADADEPELHGIEATARPTPSWDEHAEMVVSRTAAAYPPVSLTGSHLAATTTAQEG